MRLEAKKYLYDIQYAAALLAESTAGKQLADYVGHAMLRAAVERQFEIIGEALAQLARRDASVVERISDYRRIIAFRDILIHGCADVDDRLVWGMVESRLPLLRVEVATLLGERWIEGEMTRRLSTTGQCWLAPTCSRHSSQVRNGLLPGHSLY